MAGQNLHTALGKDHGAPPHINEVRTCLRRHQPGVDLSISQPPDLYNPLIRQLPPDLLDDTPGAPQLAYPECGLQVPDARLTCDATSPPDSGTGVRSGGR